MILDQTISWLILEEGTYAMENGKRVPLDNKRKNKWWCKNLMSSEPPKLMCFDGVFSDKTFRFRYGEK